MWGERLYIAHIGMTPTRNTAWDRELSAFIAVAKVERFLVPS